MQHVSHHHAGEGRDDDVHLRQQRLGEQRHGSAHQGCRHHGQVLHGGDSHGDKGGRDGEVQSHLIQPVDVLAGGDAEQGRQIPEQIEDEARDQGIGGVEAPVVLPVLERHRKHLVGQKEGETRAPAQGERQHVAAKGKAVQQMLGGDDNRRPHDG